MNQPLLNISSKIDPQIAELCAAVAQSATGLGIAYLIVGATARDMVLHHGYNARLERATADVDFALQVASWNEFSALKQALIVQGFSKTRSVQRLLSPTGWPIDVVPFGAIADEGAAIYWPPSGEVVMKVLGFQEALDNAQLVRLQDDPAFDVLVATPEGMMILKLIAWMDRSADVRRKDASDLAYLLKTYEKIPAVVDELYQQPEIMEMYKWDLTLASAHLLGVNVKRMTLPLTDLAISNLLTGQHPTISTTQLIAEMHRNQFQSHKQLLDAFAAGFA